MSLFRDGERITRHPKPRETGSCSKGFAVYARCHRTSHARRTQEILNEAVNSLINSIKLHHRLRCLWRWQYKFHTTGKGQLRNTLTGGEYGRLTTKSYLSLPITDFSRLACASIVVGQIEKAGTSLDIPMTGGVGFRASKQPGS